MADSISESVPCTKLGSVLLVKESAAVVHSIGFTRSCNCWWGLPTTTPFWMKVPLEV